MTRYQVVLKGTVDASEGGQRAFFEAFGRSYQMSADQARDWVARSQGVVYVFDDSPRAESARQFLAGLGGIAEVTAIEAPPGLPGPPRPAAPTGIRNYIKITNLADLIRDSFQLLFAHIVTLIVLMILPILPFFVLGFVAAIGIAVFGVGMTHDSEPPAAMIAVIVAVGVVILPIIFYFMLYAISAIFIAISEAAQGGKPEIMPTLRKVEPMIPVKLFGAQMLVTLLALACFIPAGLVFGLLALVLSGGGGLENHVPVLIGVGLLLFLLTMPALLYLGAIFMFVQPVIVLEKLDMIESLYRSKELGEGFYWRNLGVMMACAFVMMAASMAINLALGMVPIIGPLASMIIQNLLSVLIYIVMILLYYEMRLRKEVKL